MNAAKIPQTDSIEELARFWDTHDVTDFEGQLEEVVEPVFEREAVVVEIRVEGGAVVAKVRLSCKEAETLEFLALSKGVHVADLIRQLILERVHSL